MIRILGLFSLSVLLAAPAQAAVEALSFRAADSFQQLGVSGFSRFAVKNAAVKTTAAARPAGRPASGVISGAVNQKPVELRLDRRAWTLSGAANGGPVMLSIDHAAKTITGEAAGEKVGLNFTWSSDRMDISGLRGTRKVGMKVDYLRGGLQGYVGGVFVKLDYDRESGRLQGHAKNLPIDLRYDRISGHLRGMMHGAPVELMLVNIEIGELLQYFFLLIE